MEAQTVKKKNTLKNIILITLIVMCALILAWHLLLPMLGITIAISAGIWGVAIASIVLLCVATLLFFILTGLGALILGGIVFIWTVIAIILFPLLFPILLPILLLMLIVGLAVKKRES